jgi:hypothetical protein
VLQALDSWLAEDHSRVEARLTQRDAVKDMVELYARSCAAQVSPGLLLGCVSGGRRARTTDRAVTKLEAGSCVAL